MSPLSEGGGRTQAWQCARPALALLTPGAWPCAPAGALLGGGLPRGGAEVAGAGEPRGRLVDRHMLSVPSHALVLALEACAGVHPSSWGRLHLGGQRPPARTSPHPAPPPCAPACPRCACCWARCPTAPSSPRQTLPPRWGPTLPWRQRCAPATWPPSGQRVPRGRQRVWASPGGCQPGCRLCVTSCLPRALCPAACGGPPGCLCSSICGFLPSFHPFICGLPSSPSPQRRRRRARRHLPRRPHPQPDCAAAPQRDPRGAAPHLAGLCAHLAGRRGRQAGPGVGARHGEHRGQGHPVRAGRGHGVAPPCQPSRRGRATSAPARAAPVAPRRDPPGVAARRPAPCAVPPPRSDGGIEGVLNHEAGTLESARPADIYSTDEPAAAFHARIAFCMDVHNEVRRPGGGLGAAWQRRGAQTAGHGGPGHWATAAALRPNRQHMVRRRRRGHRQPAFDRPAANPARARPPDAAGHQGDAVRRGRRRHQGV